MSYFKLTRPFPKHSFNDICQSIQFPKKEKRSQVTKVSPAVQFYNVGQNPRIQKTRIQYIAGDLIFFFVEAEPDQTKHFKRWSPVFQWAAFTLRAETTLFTVQNCVSLGSKVSPVEVELA